MNFFESLQSAVSSVRANKMRSFLTMLGIIIGISSVITIISIGQGAKKFMTGQFEGMGKNTINIKVNNRKEGIKDKDYFEVKDAELVAKKVDNISGVGVNKYSWGDVSSEKKSIKYVSFQGCNYSGYTMDKFETVSGRPLNEGDFESGRAVTVIDSLAAKKLFNRVDIAGEKIKLTSESEKKTITVTIVGVFKSPMEKFGSMFGEQYMLYVPINLIDSLEKDPKINTLSVKLIDGDKSKETSNKVMKLMEIKHGNKGAYMANDASSGVDEFNKVLNMFTTAIGAIAGISLLVGGIGVMNIMLVSVTERTREIGIRKAIGAKSRDIKLQFLTESVILCLIGGIVGMLLGIGLGKTAGHFMKIDIPVSLTVILVSVGFSSAVGIFFGIYPASQAAKLDPIEALRYE